jgi:hypothetical protein
MLVPTMKSPLICLKDGSREVEGDKTKFLEGFSDQICLWKDDSGNSVEDFVEVEV